MAEQGEDPWEIGRRRAQRESGSLTYRNALVIEDAGSVAACLIGYRLPDAPEPIDGRTPPMFLPLLELENLAPKTWYVNVLATYPEHRGKGLGRQLLSVAEELGRETGAVGMSIIVADANKRARRLYEMAGYRAAAARKIAKETWENPSDEWVLLLKAFSP